MSSTLESGTQASTLRWELCKWLHLTKLKVDKCCLGVADVKGLVRGH